MSTVIPPNTGGTSNVSLDANVLELIKKLSIGQAASALANASATHEESTKTEITNSGNFKTIKEIFGVSDSYLGNNGLPVFDVNDWPIEIQARIPKASDGYHFNKDLLSKIAFSMRVNGPIMLYGPTGTGKTSVIREMAARLNIPFWRVGCHRRMEASDFLGSTQVINERGVPVTSHSPTDVTLACKYGGILVIDEAFRSPILMAIQSLLEVPASLTLQDTHGAQSIYNPPKDKFWLFLTDNTNGTGDSSGVYIAEAQDLSTLTRIRSSIYVDYMPAIEERKMVAKLYPNMVKADVERVVQVAMLIRDAFKSGKMMQTLDIRALLAWCENYSYTMDFSKAFNLCFGNKLSDQDYQLASNAYRQVSGNDLQRNV